MSKRGRGEECGGGSAGIKTFITKSPEETESLGAETAKGLQSGDIIGLLGELGGGKTCFVRGLARGLGVKGHVKSPSFNILNIYDAAAGGLPLYHMDLYRLGGEGDFFEAGLEDYIYSEGVSVIEWADKVTGLIEKCAVVVSFSYVNESRREITVRRVRGA